MGLLGIILLGAIAGYVATRVMQLRIGVLPTIAIGIGGALIGGFLMRFVLAFLGLLGGLVGAVLGALLLIWAWKTVMER